MKVKSLGVALALVAAAPAVIAPQLVATAHAQDRAEYPDVPKNHWAYEAIDRLSKAGIIEGQPGGVYQGNKPLTRYEFAVAVARLLEKIPTAVTGGGTITNPYVLPADIAGLPGRVSALEAKQTISPAEVNDLIAALRREFADELSKLGVRVDAVEQRLAVVEAKIAAPPRLTITPSILHRTGLANYVNNSAGGRAIVFGNGLGASPAVFRSGVFSNNSDAKFSYTDFELRLTDRVTDRLSVNAALRSISGTQEDPWAGESAANGADINIREAFAVADLSDRSFLGTKNWNVSVGRQRSKIAQGLLYDNDLNPTDQAKGTFNIGPVAVTGIIGTANNNRTFGAQPYYTQGAGAFLGGTNAVIGAGQFAGQRFSSVVGFNNLAGAGAKGILSDDNESLVRVGFNLFRIAGQPVQVGATRQFDGISSQRGDSFDLSLPLFNRTVGFEYVVQRKYADGTTAFDGAAGGDKPTAYNVTVPVLRTRNLDLNFAYGKAETGFEYMQSSSANPFARTLGEAIFDRSLALGAPLIAGQTGTTPTFMAAKKVYDVGGTLRVIRRLPLELRYYNAEGSGGVDLGHVITVGSTINVTPGLDLEVKYGQYNPDVAGVGNVKYFRVGANVGF